MFFLDTLSIPMQLSDLMIWEKRSHWHHGWSCGCLGSTTTGRRKSCWAPVERHTQGPQWRCCLVFQCFSGDDTWWLYWMAVFEDGDMGWWWMMYFPSLKPMSQDPLNSLGVSSTMVSGAHLFSSCLVWNRRVGTLVRFVYRVQYEMLYLMSCHSES